MADEPPPSSAPPLVNVVDSDVATPQTPPPKEEVKQEPVEATHDADPLPKDCTAGPVVEEQDNKSNSSESTVKEEVIPKAEPDSAPLPPSATAPPVRATTPTTTTVDESKLMEKLQSEGLLSPRPGGKSPSSVAKRRDTLTKVQKMSPRSLDKLKPIALEEPSLLEPTTSTAVTVLTVNVVSTESEATTVTVSSASNVAISPGDNNKAATILCQAQQQQSQVILPSPSLKEKEGEDSPKEDGEKKKKKRDRSQAASIVCTFKDPNGKDIACKQRAILGHVFCIRHILNDPDAPYVQCQHQRKPKNKNDTNTRCTNAIRKDRGDTFCSTHMIMQGLKESKKKPSTQPSSSENTERNTPDTISISQPTVSTIQSQSQPLQQIPMIPHPGEMHVKPQSALQSALAVHPQPPGHPGMPIGQPRMPQRVQVRISQDPLPSDGRVGVVTINGQQQIVTHTQGQLPQSGAPMVTIVQHQQPGTPTQQVQIVQAVTTGPGQQVNAVPCSTPGPSVPVTVLNAQVVSKGQLTPEQCEETLAKMNPQQRAAFEQYRIQQARKRALAQQMQQQQLQQGQGVRPPSTGTQAQHQQPPKKKGPPAFLPRLDKILSRLSPRAKEVWAMSLASRLGVSLRQSRPFSFQTLNKYNPGLAQRIHQGAKYKSFRPIFRGPCTQEELRPLPFHPPPIRKMSSDSSSEDDDMAPPKKKVIRLRQRRQQKRMVGPYRDIPQVGQMCKILEEADFDQTDLFPFGLEPSDDEEDAIFSGAPSSVLLPTSMDLEADSPDLQTELYLIKKQLRLERCALLKAAQINAPIMNAAKKFPISVGAALRQRLRGDPPPPQALINTIRRCYAVENKIRCDRACLPSSNHCAQHVIYNVNQRIFAYCTESLCSRSVLCVDAVLWDGKCSIHRERRKDKYGDYPYYPDLLQESADNSPVTSRSASAADGEDTDNDDLADSPLGDDPMSPGSDGTP